MNKRTLLYIVGTIMMLAFGFGVVAQDAPPELVPATTGDLVGDPDLYAGQTVIVEDAISEFVNSQSFLMGDNAAIGETRVLVVNTSGEPLPAHLFMGDRVVITGVVHRSLTARVDAGELTLPEDREAFRRGYWTGGMDMTNDGGVDVLPTEDPAMMPTVDPAATTDDMTATEDPAMMPTVDPAATTDDMTDDSVDMAATADPAMTSDMGTGATMSDDGRGAIDFYYAGGFPDRYDGYLVIELSNLDDISHLEPVE